MQTTLTATGAADPDHVWELYAEPSRWPSWSPQIVTVSTGDRLRPGLRGRVDGVLPFEVLAVDEAARRWSWVAGRWPARVTLHHALHADPEGSRTTLTLDGPSWLVLPYLPLAQLALRRLVSA